MAMGETTSETLWDPRDSQRISLGKGELQSFETLPSGK